MLYLDHCFIGLRGLITNKIGEVFGELWNVVLEENGKDKMVRESNEWRSSWTYINNILHRKANWIGHILRRNCLLHDAIEELMMEMKGIGRRRTWLADLRNRRRYWELKEEAEDQEYGDDSLSIKHKEEIRVIFHKSMDC